MITEPEPADEPAESAGPRARADEADVVGAEPRGRARWPWGWVLGAVLATSAAWAVTLQAVDYGRPSPPDLHHYRITGNPCDDVTLTPLARALGTSPEPADTTTRTGPTLDQVRCALKAGAPVAGTHWKGTYQVTVFIEVYKKTDPAAEFEDRNRPDGPDLDAFSEDTDDETAHVTPVRDLGDRAYLLTGSDTHRVLTVLHGGAVFTLDISALELWAGPGVLPPDADGFPQRPPSLARFDPVLVTTVRGLMTAMSR